MFERLRHRLFIAAGLAGSDPRQLIRLTTGHFSRSIVYSAALIAPLELMTDRAISCRQLTDAELLAFDHDGNPERLERLGSHRAYGVFVNGNLAHVSWLITQDIEPATGNVIKLKGDEVEITACFTLPEYRGQGLYPVAIQCISEVARQQGYVRVFMKVRPENLSSQRGIINAGLTRSGTVFHWSSALLPSGSTMLSTHRLPRVFTRRQLSQQSPVAP